MVTPFLSSATATRITDTLRHRAFLTRYQLSDPQRVVRFLTPDKTMTAAYDVIVVWANRQPAGDGSQTVDVLGQDGELQAWGEMDAPVGSLFGIDAEPAEVTDGPIHEQGITRVGFRLSREAR